METTKRDTATKIPTIKPSTKNSAADVLAMMTPPETDKQPDKAAAKKERKLRAPARRGTYSLGFTFLIIVVLRSLFELVPSLKEEIPSIYGYVTLMAQVAESLFSFSLHIIGAILGKLKFSEAFSQLVSDLRPLLDQFVLLIARF